MGWIFWLVVLEIVLVVVLMPFVAFTLSKWNIFFTRLESGNIKYIYRGDTLRKIIADVRGKTVQGFKLVNGEGGKTWIQRKLGIYWIGFPPFASVKKFKIKRRKEHEELAGKSSTEWIRDLGELEVDSLRAVFPRPFLLTEVELQDRQTVDLLVVAKFVVVDAYIPIPELKGEFFELAGSVLKGAIIDILENQGTMEDFIAANKGEGGILEALIKKPEFNQALEKRVGLHLVGITIPQWDPSDPEIREALAKKFKAEKDREAKLVEADTYSQERAIKSTADLNAEKKLAAARGLHVKAVRQNLATKGVSGEALVKAAADVLRAEAQPNLTTLVDGTNASAVVPVGGEKK